MKPVRISYLIMLLLLASCSHDYTSDRLDLGSYQWNLWIDEQAKGTDDPPPHVPSCGWEDMERGVGKLVRIPALAEEHFSGGVKGPAWYHVRFTLPEIWDGSSVSIRFEAVKGDLELYLNGELAGAHPPTDSSYSLDLTGKIYYVRDNHMSLRIHGAGRDSTGIAGKVLLKSDYLYQAAQ